MDPTRAGAAGVCPLSDAQAGGAIDLGGSCCALGHGREPRNPTSDGAVRANCLAVTGASEHADCRAQHTGSCGPRHRARASSGAPPSAATPRGARTADAALAVLAATQLLPCPSGASEPGHPWVSCAQPTGSGHSDETGQRPAGDRRVAVCGRDSMFHNAWKHQCCGGAYAEHLSFHPHHDNC